MSSIILLKYNQTGLYGLRGLAHAAIWAGHFCLNALIVLLLAGTVSLLTEAFRMRAIDTALVLLTPLFRHTLLV